MAAGSAQPAALLVPWSHPVVEARFLGRRKRFFADVALADGSLDVAHCANTGSMLGLLTEGAAALLGDHGPDSGRKLRYTLLALQTPGLTPQGPAGAWCGVLPVWANRLAELAVHCGWLPELGPVRRVLREQPLGGDSRVDLWVEAEGEWAIEVKSVTLTEGSLALFPDAKTDRGAKHLQRLQERLATGGRSAQLYVVNRDDVDRVTAAQAIDPAYAAALQRARDAGVAVWGLGCRVGPAGVEVVRRLQV